MGPDREASAGPRFFSRANGGPVRLATAGLTLRFIPRVQTASTLSLYFVQWRWSMIERGIPAGGAAGQQQALHHEFLGASEGLTSGSQVVRLSLQKPALSKIAGSATPQASLSGNSRVN